MFLFYKKFILLPILIFTSLYSMMANNYLSFWFLMEINTFTIISMMIMNKSLKKIIPFSYFFIQSISSLFMILSFINLSFFMNNYMFMMLLNISILMKMGLFPFHLWIPPIYSLISWNMIYIMSSFQKIIPLMMTNFSSMNSTFILSWIFSMWISSIMMFNQPNLKKLISYSSINYSSWMLILMFLNTFILIMFFLTYMIILLNFIYMMKHFKLKYMNSIFIQNWSMKLKLMFLYLIFSLNSIPPMTSFFTKWTSLMEFSYMNFMMINITIFITSMIMLMNYFRMCIPMILNFSNNKFSIKIKNFSFINLSLMFSLSFFFNYLIMFIYL